MSAQLMTRTLHVEQVRAIRQEGQEEGQETVFEFVASTENPVRVYDYESWEIIREILRASGAQLDGYRRNPVVLDSHRKSGSEHIAGKSEDVRIEGTQVIARIEFDDEPGSCGARNLRLVRKGMLRAVSVGYLPGPGEEIGFDPETGERIVARNSWELLEISTAPIPADPDALKRSHEAAMKNKPAAKPAAKRTAEDDSSSDDDTEEEDDDTERTGAEEEAEERSDDDDDSNDEGDSGDDDDEAEDGERTLEEESAQIRQVATQLVAGTDDESHKVRGRLVGIALEQRSPTAWTAKLQARVDELHRKTLDPALRKLGGRLIAEAENPITFDFAPALRKHLAQQASVGTPEPPTAHSVRQQGKKPGESAPETTQPKTQPETGSSLLGLLKF